MEDLDSEPPGSAIHDPGEAPSPPEIDEDDDGLFDFDELDELPEPPS